MPKSKVTKKMLEVLDKLELRKLAMVGMKLDPVTGYKFTPKDLSAWIFDRLEALQEGDSADYRPFKDVDLAGGFSSTTFRDGIYEYLIGLQKYLEGNGKPPVFGEPQEEPDAPDAEIPEGSDEDEAPFDVDEPEPTTNTSTTIIVNPTVTKTAEEPVATPVLRKPFAIRRPKAAEAPAEPTPAAPDTSELLAKVKEIAEQNQILMEEVLKLRSTTSYLSAGLLFLINSFAEDGAHLEALSDLL